MTIRVWNVQSLEQVAVLLGHTAVVAAVAFDPSGRYIASCSHDMSVRIWDAIRYEEVASLTGHTEAVCCISWDRSGRYVASGAGIDRTPCFDTTIRVWDVHAQTNVTTLTGCKYTVNTVSFDCTGRYIASASSVDNTVCIWDLKTPQHADSFKGNYSTLAWICSGKYILASKVTLNSSIGRGIACHESRLAAENLKTKMEDFVIQVFDAYTGSTVAKVFCIWI
jgi:WD40 repeat protein